MPEDDPVTMAHRATRESITNEFVKAIPWNQQTIAEFNAKKGLGVGRWGDHVLLMTATGAKSGDAITTPLVYGRDGDDYVIVASKGGAPSNPHWFGNIKANPDVEVEVAKDGGIEKFRARAAAVESREKRDKLFKYMITIWPSYADYQKRTERLIPVVVLKRQH
jgi:deazaflavin-dependent oxidoreductase (nitroreductase family)